MRNPEYGGFDMGYVPQLGEAQQAWRERGAAFHHIVAFGGRDWLKTHKHERYLTAVDGHLYDSAKEAEEAKITYVAGIIEDMKQIDRDHMEKELAYDPNLIFKPRDWESESIEHLRYFKVEELGVGEIYRPKDRSHAIRIHGLTFQNLEELIHVEASLKFLEPDLRKLGPELLIEVYSDNTHLL